MTTQVTEQRPIRIATADDVGCLTALALRSKAHWGYSDDFMQACANELSVTARDLDNEQAEYWLAEAGGVVAGYYALEFLPSHRAELDALFVDPTYIGSGVGRALVSHAIERLSRRAVEWLDIQGDPNATGFYEAMGARLVGERESGSIPGRMLPMYELDVREALRTSTGSET